MQVRILPLEPHWTLTMQDFIEIPGFEDYLIAKDGRVYSTKVNRLLKPQINTRGYLFIRFNEEKVQYSFLVHRLLAFVFLDLPSLNSELQVDHEDTNKLNNALNNLKVLTQEEHVDKTLKDRGFNRKPVCVECGARTDSVAGLCQSCKPEKVFIRKVTSPEITAEQIQYWVTNFSWTRAAKELGLSDNGLRKRFTKLTGLKPKEIHSPLAQLVAQ